MANPMIDILHPLYVHARLHPEQIAFALVERAITYRDVVWHVMSAEKAIAELSLDPDRPVGILVHHPVIHLIMAAALMKGGYATISLSQQRLGLCAALGVVDVIADVEDPLAGVRTHIYQDSWISRKIDLNDWSLAPCVPNRIMRVSLTSGSTGEPKAIGHTAETLSRSIIWETFWKVGAERVVLCQFGVGALVGYDLAFGLLRLGRTVCFSPDGPQSIGLLSKYSVDLIAGSTGQMRELLMLQRQVRGNTKSVQRVTTGGGPMTYSEMSDLMLAFNCKVDDIYASTEAGTAGISAGATLRPRAAGEGRFVITSQVKIVDPVSGAPAREGLIAVRSDVMGVAFEGHLEGGQGADATEWFYPGDLGAIDSTGLLSVTGRVDEVINFGGVKLTPEFIEAALLKHSAISDAAIVRLTHANGRIEICAAIVGPSPLTCEELNSWLRTQDLKVSIDRRIIVDAIPRADSNKIARQGVRNLFEI
jgi:acyl-coenzyme A synthetase/AMP-(fatty) acid ligase